VRHDCRQHAERVPRVSRQSSPWCIDRSSEDAITQVSRAGSNRLGHHEPLLAKHGSHGAKNYGRQKVSGESIEKHQRQDHQEVCRGVTQAEGPESFLRADAVFLADHCQQQPHTAILRVGGELARSAMGVHVPCGKLLGEFQIRLKIFTTRARIAAGRSRRERRVSAARKHSLAGATTLRLTRHCTLETSPPNGDQNSLAKRTTNVF